MLVIQVTVSDMKKNAGSEEIMEQMETGVQCPSLMEAERKTKRQLWIKLPQDSGRVNSVSAHEREDLKFGLTLPNSPKGRLLGRKSRSGKGIMERWCIKGYRIHLDSYMWRKWI